MRIAAAFAVVAMLASGSASAQNNDIVKILHFDLNGVLPSEDPQIDFVSTANESNLFSVSEGLLEQRTVGQLGGIGAQYAFPDANLLTGELDPSKSFVMEARFRVIDIVGIGAFIDVLDGTYRYSAFFFPTEVQLGWPDNIISIPLDDLSEFHTYTIASSPNSSAYNFFRDGVLLGFGTGTQPIGPLNGFQWGVGGFEGDVDWEYVAFSQPALTPIVVGVDIKPGSEKNNVNICAKGGLKVAILSTADFDVTSVNPLTVDLAGASVKLVGEDQEPKTQEQDVNSDGITDFVLHVEAADISVAENAGEAILNGQTFATEPIQGADAVNIKQQMCLRGVEGE